MNNDELVQANIANLLKEFGVDDSEINVNNKPSKEVLEGIEEYKKDLEDSVYKEEATIGVENSRKKRKNERVNEQRREARRIKKLELIASCMANIRPKYEKEVNEIKSLLKSKLGLEDGDIFVYISNREKYWVSFAQANQYRTFEESLEENYSWFVKSLLEKLREEN